MSRYKMKRTAKRWTSDEIQRLTKRWEEVVALGTVKTSHLPRVLAPEFPGRTKGALWMKHYAVAHPNYREETVAKRKQAIEGKQTKKPDEDQQTQQVDKLITVVMNGVADFVELQCKVIVSQVTELKRRNQVLLENNQKLSQEINETRHLAKPGYKQKLTRIAERMLGGGEA